MTDVPLDVLQFVRGETDPATFPHREHVRMTFEMLQRHEFVETALHCSRALTAKTGQPGKFHQTAPCHSPVTPRMLLRGIGCCADIADHAPAAASMIGTMAARLAARAASMP